MGQLKLRRRYRVLAALTEDNVYLLEYHYRITRFSVGGVICVMRRAGLVADCTRQPWAWPTTWRARLSWPHAATYVDGALMAGKDAELIVGLLVGDRFRRCMQPNSGLSAR